MHNITLHIMHHTKDKGDLAVIKVMADLAIKGYSCFIPISEHLPIDLIAAKAGETPIRIQVKYLGSNVISSKTSWNDKNGNHVKFYDKNDFDYFAGYLPDVDKIIYPHITIGVHAKFITKLGNQTTQFYWYEDYLDFTKEFKKRTLKDFGLPFNGRKGLGKGRVNLARRKVERPTKEELEKLLWEKPTTKLAEQFGVSDKAIEKWTKSYGLTKPARGYWAKYFNSKIGQLD